MYKSFDVTRTETAVSPIADVRSAAPKALMFHAIYRNPGGEEQSFANESRLLESIGYETVRCTTENNKISRRPWAGAAAVFSPRVLVDALRIIRSERPDIVYVNNLWPSFSASLLVAARVAGIPTLQAVRNYRLVTPSAKLRADGTCTECGSTNYFTSCVRNGCYGNSRLQSLVCYLSAAAVKLSVLGWKQHRFVATSAMTARLVEGRLIESHRVVVRPNFGFEENEPEFRSNDSVVCVSRLTPEKGVLDLVRNWPQGAGSPSLTVIGDGPQYGEISSLSTALGNVTMAGFTSHEDVIEILRHSAASVVPSQWAEPFGRVAIESMSVGTPVIYATSGALADIVGPGGTPLHSLEESSIREALARILGADDRSAIRKSAYRHYASRFTSRKAATSMRELINEVSS